MCRILSGGVCEVSPCSTFNPFREILSCDNLITDFDSVDDIDLMIEAFSYIPLYSFNFYLVIALFIYDFIINSLILSFYHILII